MARSFEIPSMEPSPVSVEHQGASDPIQQSHLNMENIISEMQEKSPYDRESLNGGALVKLIPKEKKELGEFYIKHITDPNDPKVQKIADFMDIFKPGEFDVEEIAKNVSYDCYGYFVIEDAEGNTIGLVQSSYVEGNLSQESYSEYWNGDRSDKGILFMGYIVVSEKMRREGLSIELNQSAFQFANERAKALNQSLEAVVVEGSTDIVEHQANKIGLNRMYMEDKEGNYRELPFLQPPMVWDRETASPIDPETGEVKHGATKEYSVPEHLMARMINGRKDMTAEEVLWIVAALYEDNYEDKKFPGDIETPAIVVELKKLMNELKSHLEKSKDGKVKMISVKERKKLERQGKKFVNHDLASEGIWW